MAINKYIVLDMQIPSLMCDRVFSDDVAATHPGTSIWRILRRKAAAIGLTVHTADVYLARGIRAPAVCLSNEGQPGTVAKLVNAGVSMGVLWCGESPNIAWQFYHHLHSRAIPFHSAFVFRGALARLPSFVNGSPFKWPCSDVRVIGKNFNSRAICALVASAKSQVPVNYGSLLSRFARLVRLARIRGLQFRDPLLRFRDLYKTRLDIIEVLAPKKGFHLFGRGWLHAKNLRKGLTPDFFFNQPKECLDKKVTISNYRFTLCIENCVFPGYVTEKIYDALLAGSVPVYLGAPDIGDFVDENAFIDMRNFSDFRVMWRFLEGCDEKQWEQYRRAGDHYLETLRFQASTDEIVAEEFLWTCAPQLGFRKV